MYSIFLNPRGDKTQMNSTSMTIVGGFCISALLGLSIVAYHVCSAEFVQKAPIADVQKDPALLDVLCLIDQYLYRADLCAYSQTCRRFAEVSAERRNMLSIRIKELKELYFQPGGGGRPRKHSRRRKRCSSLRGCSPRR